MGDFGRNLFWNAFWSDFLTDFAELGRPSGSIVGPLGSLWCDFWGPFFEFDF